MQAKKRVMVLASIISFCARAEETVVAERHTLKDFIQMAEKNGAGMDEQRAKVEAAKARSDWARSKAFPQGSLEAYVAPVPGATGDAVNGATHWDNWGAAYGAKLELMQPIYTFGALSAAREAARSGLHAEELLLEKNHWSLRSEITELYYSYQYAFEMSELTSGIIEQLQKALDRGERARSSHSSKAPKMSDLDKLRGFLLEARVRENEATTGMAEARAAMAWKTGTLGTVVPKWDKANLIATEINLKNFEEYKTLCQQKRPELQALQMDTSAKTALIDVEVGQLLPSLGLVARGSYGKANGRANQSSPFAYDPANEMTGTIALGLKWDLSFFERSAKVSQARADLLVAEARQRYFSLGILVELEKAYLDLVHLKESVKWRTEAEDAAKRSLHDAGVAFNLGTGSAKDYLESLGTFAMAQKSKDENILQFNVAIAKFEQALGAEL